MKLMLPLGVPRSRGSRSLEQCIPPYGATTGEVLARQDKLQEKLYLVLEGELQVSKNGQPIASVCAGDFAGEVIVAKVDFWIAESD